MSQVNLLQALAQSKCPRCRKGNIFQYSALNLTSFHKMNTYCPHCEVQLEPEPGFYQGAMYVGYGFTVAVTVIVSILLYYFFGNPSEWIYIGIIIGIMTLAIPLNYRYSRVLYLYMFGGIRFDKRFVQ